MQQLFEDLPEALENSVEIARRCSLELQLGEYSLPEFPIPEGLTANDYFIQLSERGLRDRLSQRAADELSPTLRVDYDERLKFELDIIIQMGFTGYFLIVMDFILWAKNHDIPVGPGRGSGAGSLVAYALQITDIDPLTYDLLFERFLNPERVSMPDFDIDFCMEGRDRGDFIRCRTLRPSSGVADRYLWHHGSKGGSQRCRTGAGKVVRVSG